MSAPPTIASASQEDLPWFLRDVLITESRRICEETRQICQELGLQRARLDALERRPCQYPTAVLPDPPKLLASSNLHGWMLETTGKLQVDGDAFGSDKARFYYVFGLLSPNIQKIVIPQLAHAERNQKWDYKTILVRLLHAYGDIAGDFHKKYPHLYTHA